MLPCDLWNWDIFSLTLCYINVTNHIPVYTCVCIYTHTYLYIPYILHVALLGNFKTFQRLPIYQYFKRQLNKCYLHMSSRICKHGLGESLEECSQLDSQEQHFSEAVLAQLGNAITKFGLLQRIDIQWSFLLLFPIYFPPVSEFMVRFQLCLWNNASCLRCLSCHTPSKPPVCRSMLGCSPQLGSSHKCTYRGGPTCLICFRLNNEFSEWVNNFLIPKTPVLYARELLKLLTWPAGYRNDVCFLLG